MSLLLLRPKPKRAGREKTIRVAAIRVVTAPSIFWSFQSFSATFSASRYVYRQSEAWGPPQFQEKRSRTETLSEGEKAILGAFGEFRGILGARKRIYVAPYRTESQTNLCNSMFQTSVLNTRFNLLPEIVKDEFSNEKVPPCCEDVMFQDLTRSL